MLSISLQAGTASRPSAGTDALSIDDQVYIDSMFDTILSAVEQGEDIDPDSLAPDRPELREALAQLLEVAKAACPTAVRDSFPRAPEGFTIISELGRGGMASVYLARQHSLADRPVALKMLPELLTTSSTRERFRREVAAIASLRHPHIVPVYDVVRASDSFSFAMEFIDGGSLQDVIHAVASRGDRSMLDAAIEPLAISTSFARPHDYCALIATWGLQIADALHAVHAAGLLHRDVKPSNILIRRDGVALLSDFGLVRDSTAATLTVSGAFSGTASYSPPEQLLATRALDARSDVYSLGATLFHALTLRRPYVGESAVQVLHAIGDRSAPPMRDARRIPRDLETVVRKAMDPEANRRYATAAEFAADLGRFLEGRAVLARPATLAYTTSKLAVRYRTQFAAGVLASLVVAVLASLVFVRVVWWPQWSNQALVAARSAAFEPRPYDAVFNIAFFEHVGDPRPDAQRLAASNEVRSRLARSVALYNEAITYGAQNPSVLAERDAATRIMTYITRRRSTTSALADAPLVDAYIRWLLDPTSPESDPFPVNMPSPAATRLRGALANAPAHEARQIGLIAYVLADTQTALMAWSRLDALESTDAFAEGVLGILMLIKDQPYPAFARLYRASLEFPDDGNFAMYAADAALQCGDMTKAHRLLGAARALGTAESSGMERLALMLRLAQGDLDGVVRETRRMFATPYAPASVVLALQIAQHLERSNQPNEHVLEFAALAASGVPPAAKAVEFLWPYAERYWLGSTHARRRELLIRMMIASGDGPVRGKTWETSMLSTMTYVVGVQKHPISNQLHTSGFLDFANRVMSINLDTTMPALSATFATDDDELKNRLADWFLTGDGVQPQELLNLEAARSHAQE
jgi:serine/threonine protein kinase